ncbi:MAG: tRNA 2-selenouridine(34) synthase MnmH [Bdellovibrio sp.]
MASGCNIKITIQDLKNQLLKGSTFIDVRAPVEFVQGHLPGAVNAPILNDLERARIGTTYRHEGQDAAVRLGYQLISGAVKEGRLQCWMQILTQHPESIVYCFRGGKRSQITQQWLKEAGWDVPLIQGGYKASRQFLTEELDALSRGREMIAVSGPTGSGKTLLLQEVKTFYPAVNLEQLASHRGSAFGSYLERAQPSQADFENQLALQLMYLHRDSPRRSPLLVEDESRLIGRLYQPASFFESLREAPLIWLEEPLAQRVENIYEEYVLKTPLGLGGEKAFRCAEEREILWRQAVAVFEKYKSSLRSLHRKLGGQRSLEIMQDMERAEAEFFVSGDLLGNKIWIEKLLKYYYDPLYQNSLERRQVRIIFHGNRQEALQYIKSL